MIDSSGRSYPPSHLAMLALGLALLVPLAACAAGQGRIHAPPPPESGAKGDDGHDEADDTVPVVPYDQSFELAYGAAVKVEHSDTRARFVELVEDSRCPRDVRCVQAGRARVRLEVRRGDAAPVSIELSTDQNGSLASAGGVTWELQAVEPYPTAGAERRAEQYVLTLAARPLR